MKICGFLDKAFATRDGNRHILPIAMAGFVFSS